MSEDKFDGALLAVLQNCGELEPFLDVILGFLHRKTDFFRLLSADRSMGFPPGVAREKLLKVFEKYEALSNTAHAPPPPLTEPKITPVVTSVPLVATTPKPTPPTPPMTPGEPLKQEEIQGDFSTSQWDHHNGGVTKDYAWSQTAQDVDVKMVLPRADIKASDLKIDIKSHGVQVQLKQDSTDMKTILQRSFHDPIKAEESMWSLHKGECIQISLEKVRDGYWWTELFKDDTHQISLDSIDTTRHMHEFPQEEVACVQKLMFDQRQKQLGLPTSEEMQQEEILQKAWNAKGSPFAGTEYDSSKVNFSNDLSNLPNGPP